MIISKSEGGEQQVDSKAAVCPNCGSARESVLEQVPSPASYILSIGSVFYFGIWSIFIIPLIFQSTKIIVKRCYYCNVELESRRLFQIPNLNDKVLQFSFGGCMIVVSRKYAAVLLCIFIALFFYVELNKEEPEPEHVKYSTKSWVEFLALCGKYQFVDNGLLARHHFESEFKQQVLKWKGDFVSVKSNYDMQYPQYYWIYVKMDPTESQEDVPDLVLGVTQNILDELQALQKGQPIQFEAQFLALGTEHSYHLMALRSYSKLNKPVENIKELEHFTIKDQEELQEEESPFEHRVKKVIHMYKRGMINFPILQDPNRIPNILTQEKEKIQINLENIEVIQKSEDIFLDLEERKVEEKENVQQTNEEQAQQEQGEENKILQSDQHDVVDDIQETPELQDIELQLEVEKERVIREEELQQEQTQVKLQLTDLIVEDEIPQKHETLVEIEDRPLKEQTLEALQEEQLKDLEAPIYSD